MYQGYSIRPSGTTLTKLLLSCFNRRVFGGGDRVDAELEEILRPLRGEALFVFHPAFGYFADRYGLEQIAIEIEGREPGPRQLEEIIEHAKEQGVRVIFVQPQFSKKSAETVARAIDGAVVPIDPLAYDWLDNLKRIGEKVRQGLSK